MTEMHMIYYQPQDVLDDVVRLLKRFCDEEIVEIYQNTEVLSQFESLTLHRDAVIDHLLIAHLDAQIGWSEERLRELEGAAKLAHRLLGEPNKTNEASGPPLVA